MMGYSVDVTAIAKRIGEAKAYNRSFQAEMH
jgi:hypothetical protein